METTEDKQASKDMNTLILDSETCYEESKMGDRFRLQGEGWPLKW